MMAPMVYDIILQYIYKKIIVKKIIYFLENFSVFNEKWVPIDVDTKEDFEVLKTYEKEFIIIGRSGL